VLALKLCECQRAAEIGLRGPEVKAASLNFLYIKTTGTCAETFKKVMQITLWSCNKVAGDCKRNAIVCCG
jgi:hypothetical protein